jgi:hypothetical protein
VVAVGAHFYVIYFASTVGRRGESVCRTLNRFVCGVSVCVCLCVCVCVCVWCMFVCCVCACVCVYLGGIIMLTESSLILSALSAL